MGTITLTFDLEEERKIYMRCLKATEAISALWRIQDCLLIPLIRDGYTIPLGFQMHKIDIDKANKLLEHDECRELCEIIFKGFHQIIEDLNLTDIMEDYS